MGKSEKHVYVFILTEGKINWNTSKVAVLTVITVISVLCFEKEETSSAFAIH